MPVATQRSRRRPLHQREIASAGRRLAGVGDQDLACPNGTLGCPGPGSGSGQLPCADCFLEGGDLDD
jgi:hypothetical protein